MYFYNQPILRMFEVGDYETERCLREISNKTGIRKRKGNEGNLSFSNRKFQLLRTIADYQSLSFQILTFDD